MIGGQRLDSFLQWNSWWSQQFSHLIEPGGRFASTKAALNFVLQRGGTTIVETGTVRMPNDWAGAGMTTLLLGSFCEYYKCHLWTVDNEPNAIELAKQLTRSFESAITYVLADSIEFLGNFALPIDLLYLDSMDCPPGNSEPESLRRSQEHQRSELVAAWDKLHAGSVVLLDDNDFSNGGKCRLANELLAESGWTCVLAEKQVLWMWDSGRPFPAYCPMV